jgi:hypothetical protein
LLDFRKNLSVLLRIDNIHAAAKNAYGGARRRAERSFVGTIVDSARQPVDDNETPISQISRQPLCHLIPVRGGTTRPDDRECVAIEKIRVSLHIEKRRGVANLAQELRIVWLIPGDRAAFGRVGLHHCAARCALAM